MEKVNSNVNIQQVTRPKGSRLQRPQGHQKDIQLILEEDTMAIKCSAASAMRSSGAYCTLAIPGYCKPTVQLSAQGESEGAATSDFRFHPGQSMVAGDDLPDMVLADARTRCSAYFRRYVRILRTAGPFFPNISPYENPLHQRLPVRP